MLLHKLHIHDWEHMLTILNEDLFKMDASYKYRQSDELKLQDTINKIEQIVSYLKKVNTHLMEEGNKLVKVKQKILTQEEGTNQSEARQIAHDKEYYADQFPQLITNIPRLEHLFIELQKQLHGVKNNMYDGKLVDNVNRAKEIIRQTNSTIQTIKSISRVMANDLKDRYKHIRLEMAQLKEEGNMVHHLDHNIESWFMH